MRKEKNYSKVFSQCLFCRSTFLRGVSVWVFFYRWQFSARLHRNISACLDLKQKTITSFSLCLFFNADIWNRHALIEYIEDSLCFEGFFFCFNSVLWCFLLVELIYNCLLLLLIFCDISYISNTHSLLIALP